MIPKTHFRLLLPSLLLLAILPLVGCTTVGLEAPDVTLVDLQLEDVTLLESSGSVVLRLANSNPDPLQVDGLAFELKLDGRRVGQALSSEVLEVPRLSTGTVQAELSVNHLSVLSLIQGALETEKVDYELSGKVYVQTDFGRRTLRIKKSGIFDFEGTLPEDLDLGDLDIDVESGESGGGESDQGQSDL